MVDAAVAGHRAARERLLALGAVSAVRRAPGYVAIRSGLDSNDLNGVIAESGFVPSALLVAELVAWMDDVPAQWLAAAPDPALTVVLEGAGLAPERTGWWCGLEVGMAARAAPDVERVWSLDEWTTVATSCGWGERPTYD